MKAAAIGLSLLVAAAGPALSKTATNPDYIASSPDLGKAAGRCRPAEPGPAVNVTILGLKDRAGNLRAEVYPPHDGAFLQDDNLLIMAGKTFRRVENRLPQSGPVRVCVRLPGPGIYTMSVLHDRDMNRKFGISSDGIGFPGNPRLGLSKPRAASASFVAGSGVTEIAIRLNYRRGMFRFGPLKQPG